MRSRLACVAALCVLAAGKQAAGQVSAPDIVIDAATVTRLQGNWSKLVTGAGASQRIVLASADRGWATATAPLATPTDFFETTFPAVANTPYHVWVRLHATGNSKWNDSIWVQFSDATDRAGAAVYRVGSASALMINLENCTECGVAAWGWQDHAWWLTTQSPIVKFASGGLHTIRVQTREDGVIVDQIVLSPATYLSASPGQVMNDTTIVHAPPPSAGSTPFYGTPLEIPGTIQADDFDNGGEGIAYHDDSKGNAGGADRQTDVDIAASSEGGHTVGWIGAGEWVRYTVKVLNTGAYVAQLRVASPLGGTLRIGLDAGAGPLVPVTIPATGGWQAWGSVNVPLSLTAGVQHLTLFFDTGGYNVSYVKFASASSPTAPTAPPKTTPTPPTPPPPSTPPQGSPTSGPPPVPQAPQPQAPPPPPPAPAPRSRVLVFHASPDNNVVTRYVLDVYLSLLNVTLAVPLASADLGKPALDANGDISVDVGAFLNSLVPGLYVATVSATNAAGRGQSVAVSFTR